MLKKLRAEDMVLNCCGGPHSPFDTLPHEVWDDIFSFLSLNDLLVAEKVCQRWKEAIDRHLARKRHLIIQYYRRSIIMKSDLLRIARQCGPNLRKLTIGDLDRFRKSRSILDMIVDHCPSLHTLILEGVISADGDVLISLTHKCPNLQHLELRPVEYVSDYILFCILKSSKQLKRLRINSDTDGPMFMSYMQETVEEISFNHINYRAAWMFHGLIVDLKNLRKLSFDHMCVYDETEFQGFRKTCENIKDLSITNSKAFHEIVFEISKMIWLEKLDFSFNNKVDDVMVVDLLNGHPLLKSLRLGGNVHSQISDSGVEHIVQHCPQLLELDISGNDKVTDLSLESVAEFGIIRRLVVQHCNLITDVGCINLVNRCPRLELLDIRGCSQLTKAILVPCLLAVKNRSDKQLLKLMVAGTGITKFKVKHHDRFPLIVDYQETNFG